MDRPEQANDNARIRPGYSPNPAVATIDFIDPQQHTTLGKPERGVNSTVEGAQPEGNRPRSTVGAFEESPLVGIIRSVPGYTVE